MTIRSESPDSPTPIAIVGMHRSGTSMVAKQLSQAGLFLGPDSALMPPASENPEGFFEHLAFVDLNDEELLRTLDQHLAELTNSAHHVA